VSHAPITAEDEAAASIWLRPKAALGFFRVSSVATFRWVAANVGDVKSN
jgi:hypothetical protein